MANILARHKIAQPTVLRQNGWALFFLGPWIMGFLVFTAGPMIGSLYFSFTDYDLLSSPVWTGLGNFQRMFTADPVFLKSLSVTTIYVVVGVPIQ